MMYFIHAHKCNIFPPLVLIFIIVTSANQCSVPSKITIFAFSVFSS